jgi:hypothetical protein
VKESDRFVQYRLLDMHGGEVATINSEEAHRLIIEGYARTFRTRASYRVAGVILIVPLTVLNGNTDPERPLSLANYTGTRFVFRQKISTAVANFYSYRHKRMHPAEAPEYGLARILHCPAVEGPVRQLKSEKECPQLIPDVPAKSRTCGGSKRYRARSVAAQEVTFSPLRPPIAARAA